MIWYVTVTLQILSGKWDGSETCPTEIYRTKKHAEIALKYIKEAHAKAHEEIGE